MAEITPGQAQAVALRGLLAERYRRTYLHDLRGGLQTIHNAVELLTRSANSPGDNSALVEKAAALAKRAVASFESLIERTLDELLPGDEETRAVEISDLVREVSRFLQNYSASQAVTVRFSAPGSASAMVAPRSLRLAILGLITLAIDQFPQGGDLRVSVGQELGEVSVDILGCDIGATTAFSELTISVARELVAAYGGRLVFRPGLTDDAGVRVCLPLLAAAS